MVKYHEVYLEIKGKDLIGVENLSAVEKNALKNQNVIYIYRATKTKKIYICQTGNFILRHNQHYDGTEERFNTADFEEVKGYFQDTLTVRH